MSESKSAIAKGAAAPDTVHPGLAEAIVATFRDPPQTDLARRLLAYDLEAWNRTYTWLDNSGLEFYFLARLQALGLEGSVPQPFLARMRHNLAGNVIRTAGLIQEFVRVNQALQAEQLTYCNVKGIALAPIPCPDLSLRRQVNLDFMVSASEFERCQAVLGRLGYSPHSPTRHFCEFFPIANPPEPGTSLYRQALPQSIAVYLLSADAHGVERAPYAMLMRRQPQTWKGYTFPAPNDADHFIAQAIRMLGQVGFEWSRLAFLWEFKASLEFWHNHPQFWHAVQAAAQEHPLRPVAIATAARLAAEIFGATIPPPILEWSSTQLDPGVQQWAERPGWGALISGCPGTTLRDLLERQTASNSPLS